MSLEVLVNEGIQETRVAVIENGLLQEIHIEHQAQPSGVGAIYIGKVVRILPGMQAAFVDIGAERTAFLHASDIRQSVDQDQIKQNGELQVKPIQTLLHDGQRLMVQVIKDPYGTKGARLTNEITIPGRNLVLLPENKHIGVSQRISDENVRQQLKSLVQETANEHEIEGGFIVRTLAETATKEDMVSDMQYLSRIWQHIQEKRTKIKKVGIVWNDISVVARIIRDFVTNDVDWVRLDSKTGFDSAKEFARDLFPSVSKRIKYHKAKLPLFEMYGVEDEINRALNRSVPLKSGGYLVIDQTEAMTVIDINTGSYIGRSNLEKTIYRTNLEAAQAIARQLRLRNIGGIIIIDFIDMEEEEHRRQVMRALEKSMAKDRTKSFITEMSSLGLVEVTRKRTRENLEQLLCESCSVCDGRGFIKTPRTICYEIFRDILRVGQEFEPEGYVVVAAQPIIDVLLDDESESLAELQSQLGHPIRLQVEPTFHQEMFDVVLL